MGSPDGITNDSERQDSWMSSSSAIPMSSTRNIEDSSDRNTDEDGDPPTLGEQLVKEDGVPPTLGEQLVAIWRIIVEYWKNFTAWFYFSTVSFLGEFLADILSHPKLHDVAVDLIVNAINNFMNQEDIGSKVDDTARRVIYDVEKARDTSHAIGKEVLPMVAGFVGGMASSLKPSEIKKRKERRKHYSNRQSKLIGSDEVEDEGEYTVSKKSN